MSTYQTVKPVDNNEFVSNEYTTINSYRPRNVRKGLDLDEDDEPTGGLVPIGDPDIYIIISIFLLYLFYHIIKNKKIKMDKS